MSHLVSDIEKEVRGILADGDGGEYDETTLLLAVNFAQVNLAKATRLTMKRDFAEPAHDGRRYNLPEDLIDLDTVYLNGDGGGVIV